MWFLNGFGGVFSKLFKKVFYISFSRDQCLHLHPNNEKEVEMIRRWIQMEIPNVGSGVYSKLSQTSKIELFTKIISLKGPIIDV